VTGPKPSIGKTVVGKVVIVTGANTGIGKETARQLLAAGATVVMACRSESRAKEAMKDILAKVEGERQGSPPTEGTTLVSPKERLLFIKCDVSDYDSVRSAVKDFEKMNLKLDILINNAGIMMGTRKENKIGHEMNMACNHLGHFLLTNLLMPKLQQADDGRIIIITSSTYVLANQGFDLEDWNCEKRKYTMFSQYAQSKLANILMGKELTRREAERIENAKDKKPVGIHIVHPGLVRTEVVRNMPWYLRWPNIVFSLVLMSLQKSPEAGAYTTIFCATSQSLVGQSGDYFSNSQVYEVNEFANDVKAAKAVWDLSVTLTTR
jgi:NAD(P)-dependent dehydrogenase (short-subunit alcohol dehydrogenase family)